jgi:tetrahydromethanopterin S-methyltransferase subunit F
MTPFMEALIIGFAIGCIYTTLLVYIIRIYYIIQKKKQLNK